MAKIKAVLFWSDFCEDGKIKFEAGKNYPKNAETERCILLNFGEDVSVDKKQITEAPAMEETVAAASEEVAPAV